MSTAAELLPAYETWLRSWGAAETTIEQRHSVLRRCLAETDCTPDGLAAWLAQYEGWTKGTYYAGLVSFFGWAAATGRLPADPTQGLRRPRTPKNAPRPLSEDELLRVLAVVEGRERAYVLLGLYAGLRAHEVAKIRGEDVTPESIYVLGKGRKAAHVPTHPVLWALAQEMPRQGLWFPSPRRPGQPITPTAVSLSIGKLFRSLGIEGAHHRLRHSYGTKLLRSGASLRVVQELMRHESVVSTQIYTQVTDQERTDAILRLGMDSAHTPAGAERQPLLRVVGS